MEQVKTRNVLTLKDIIDSREYFDIIKHFKKYKNNIFQSILTKIRNSDLTDIYYYIEHTPENITYSEKKELHTKYLIYIEDNLSEEFKIELYNVDFIKIEIKSDDKKDNEYSYCNIL